MSGCVLDAEEETAVSFATIRVIDADGESLGSTQADGEGCFTFRVEEPGHYRVEATGFGYRAAITDLVAVTSDAPSEVTIRMAPDPFGLDPLEVVADRRDQLNHATYEGLHQRRVRYGRRGFARVFLRGDEELERAMSVADVLRAEGPPRARAGQCLPTILYRGVEPPPGMARALLDLPTGSVEGLELYRRSETAPPGIRPTAASGSCGVAVLWPRRAGDGPW